MKRLLPLILIIAVSTSACKKTAITGTGNLTAAATIQRLTANAWTLISAQGGAGGPYVLEFSTADSHTGITGGTVAFGQLSSNGMGLGSGSTDTFNISIIDGTTYLTVTDDIAAISLTGFSTQYKITAISSSGFSMSSASQATSAAPSFPAATTQNYMAANFR